jgi:uncharacterized protein YggE
MRSYKFWFISLITLILVISPLLLTQTGLIATPAQAQTEPVTTDPLAQTITVVGEGVANVEPDTAQATIGVQVIDPNLSEATNAVQQRMEAVLTALQEQGIAEQDIQTANFNIFVERPFESQPQPQDQQDQAATDELIYHVNNDVQVTIRDLDNVGTILNAAIEAGANNIYGVNFTISDDSQARAQAREAAINNAATQAEDLASLAGVQLGQVVRIREVISGGGQPLPALRVDVGGAAPIEPGQLEVRVQLEVVYAMQ